MLTIFHRARCFLIRRKRAFLCWLCLLEIGPQLWAGHIDAHDDSGILQQLWSPYCCTTQIFLAPGNLHAMSSFSCMSGILHEVFIHVSCFLQVAPRRSSHQGAQARNIHKTSADLAQLVITLRYDRFFTRPPLPCFFRFWTEVVSLLRSPTKLGLAFRCTVWGLSPAVATHKREASHSS